MGLFARGERSSSRHWFWPALTTTAIVVMSARIIATYPVFNDTVDEPYHIGAGMGMLESGRHVHGVQHPPLARLVAAIPLWLRGVRSPEARGDDSAQWDLVAFEIGHRVLLNSSLQYWSALTTARAAMIVFPVATVIYVYLLGRLGGGLRAGALAAIFVSTDPTLLAHGGLVTTDVAAAAGFLAIVYHGVRLIGRPTARSAAIAGVVTGLALACKYSCVLALPALLILLVIHRRRAMMARRWRVYFAGWPRVRHFAIAGLCTFAALWACFFFDFAPLDRSSALDGTPEWEAIPVWLRHLPIPMPSAIIGGITLMQHSAAGHGAMYLNGQIDSTGWWYYFPEAILLKSPAALVLGIVLAPAAWMLHRRRVPRIGLMWIPCAVFLLASMNSRINIGVRHVLPAIPLLYLAVVLVLTRVGMRPVVWILPIVAFVETLWVHPDQLAFFNLLAGGPSGGHRYLLDSNLDWGQDQARLAAWLDEHARGRVVTSRIFGNPRLREWPHPSYEVLPPGSTPRGLLVISLNHLSGLYPSIFEDARGVARLEPDVRFVRQMDPIARIGYTILVYDLDAPRR